MPRVPVSPCAELGVLYGVIIITLFLYSAFKTVSQSALHNKTSENPTHTRQLIKTKIKLKLNSQEKANPKKLVFK